MSNMNLADVVVIDREFLDVPSIDVTSISGLKVLLCKKIAANTGFTALEAALQAFGKRHKNIDVFSELLPQILCYARDHSQAPRADKALLLKQGTRKAAPRDGLRTLSVTVSSDTIRYLLANAFFLNLGGSISSVGSLHLGALYRSTLQVAAERVLCLLSYFAQEYAAILPSKQRHHSQDGSTSNV